MPSLAQTTGGDQQEIAPEAERERQQQPTDAYVEVVHALIETPTAEAEAATEAEAAGAQRVSLLPVEQLEQSVVPAATTVPKTQRRSETQQEIAIGMLSKAASNGTSFAPHRPAPHATTRL